MELDAYYMDTSSEDQRLPHRCGGAVAGCRGRCGDSAAHAAECRFWSFPACRLEPNVPTSPQALRCLGVLSWAFEPDTEAGAEKLAAIRKVRGYSYEVRRGRREGGGCVAGAGA